MKYKVIACIVCILSLISAMVATVFPKDQKVRYHQHLEAEETAVCRHDDNIFCTHLPLLQIETGGQEIPGAPILTETGHRTGYYTTNNGEKLLKAGIKVHDASGVNHHLTDEPDLRSDIMIRVRGTSSRRFDKHGYLIRLVDQNGLNNPQSVAGMDAHHEWVLHGPFLDKTLVRNYLWYNISGEMMGYAPNVRFCELILNGEYQGVYLVTESITAGTNGTRLNLTVNKKKNEFSGYLLRVDRGSETEVKNIRPFLNYTKMLKTTKYNIEYPGTKNLTPEMAEAIRLDYSEFERMLFSFDYDNEAYGYLNHLEMDSFVDYFLINEFSCNYDAGALSTYIYKDVEGIYHMCVWDFNNACDNYQEQKTETDNFLLYESLWYYMLMKDEDFTQRIIDRYRMFRTTFLSEEYLYQYIDDTIAYLGPAVERNFEKWGYIFEPGMDRLMLIPTDRNLHSFEEAVAQLKQFIHERGTWMDTNIECVRQYSAESKAKLYNEHTH